MGIQHVSPDTDIDVILGIIERDAAVVIDDVLTKKDLDEYRKNFGVQLAKETDIKADIVMVTDSLTVKNFLNQI